MGGSIGNRQDRAVLSRAAPRAFRTRGPRGWDCWGDEIGKFDEQAAATNNSISINRDCLGEIFPANISEEEPHGDALHVPDRHRRRFGHRLDELHRQPWRLLRSNRSSRHFCAHVRDDLRALTPTSRVMWRRGRLQALPLPRAQLNDPLGALLPPCGPVACASRASGAGGRGPRARSFRRRRRSATSTAAPLSPAIARSSPPWPPPRFRLSRSGGSPVRSRWRRPR